ncbi:MAG: TonB-dependent receptor plug domain-containing protein [Arcobacter sp.]|uniref:TonB-dependent receptor plug domain-containing protein n=1 Tax=Arcobacter sp. TaxID=1872629 RepID=UPI003B00AD07
MAENNPILDATNISFEELLNTEYIPASHIANKVSKASSAVSIVTAQDIKDYGYRSLGEILGSMRGLHVFQNYEYGFLGGRGFSATGEYAGRIAVLIDGYRADDAMYGQAYFGHDGILDVAMIERVEYIPGGGSAGYSSGALLGVINIITKNGRDIDGGEFALGYGSHNSRTKRVALGKSFDNGLEILLNASKYDTSGRTFTYDINGIDTTFSGQNREKNHRIFLKASYENISLESAYLYHEKNIPSYPYHVVNSEFPVLHTDKNRFTRLSYDKDILSSLKLSASLWSGEYHYFSHDVVVFEPDIEEYSSDSKWFGSDMKFVSTGWDNHILSFGAEYRNDYALRWIDTWIETATNTSHPWWTEYYENRQTYSLYGYDEFKLTPSLNLNYGLRYEDGYNEYHATSPQVAIIWQAGENTLLKLSSEQIHRRATVSEGDYISSSISIPEKAKTTELVIEQDLVDNAKITTSLFRYHIANRIGWFELPDIVTKGVEVEFEKHWQNATRIKMSYSFQNSKEKDTKLALVNSPKHLAKLNLSVPLINERLRMGLEVQYIGKRLLDTTERKEYAPSHTLTNLTFTSHHFIPNTNISFAIKNLMDKKYGDVVSEQMNGDLYYPQDGRTFWFEMEYKF